MPSSGFDGCANSVQGESAAISAKKMKQEDDYDQDFIVHGFPHGVVAKLKLIEVFGLLGLFERRLVDEKVTGSCERSQESD